MDIGKTKFKNASNSLINGLFFGAMFTLPWINYFRASTFLLLISGVVILLSGHFLIEYSQYGKQLVFRLLLVYYLLQIIALCIFPYSKYTHTDAEHKASLVFIPILLYILTKAKQDVWINGIKWFIRGIIFASVWCFLTAIFKFYYSHDSSLFFYHRYSQPLKLNAIYFSIYILVALGYHVLNGIPDSTSRFQTFMIGGTGLFLFLNLVLLSSKMMVVTGIILLVIIISLSFKKKVVKMTSLFAIFMVCLVIAFTSNPVKTRYTDLSFNNIHSSYGAKDFTGFPFDGLSIRLVLWRLGNELINEKKFWLFGAGGSQYHESLNLKIIQYHLYSGDGTEADNGYKNYNMHNQFMETYVQFGITGVLILLSLLYYIFWNSIANHHAILIYILLLFTVAFLSESLLETQSGILLFTIIISGEWIQLQKKLQANQSKG